MSASCCRPAPSTTYSAYARGTDALGGVWQWLDRAPRGRNERNMDLRLHDQYRS